MPLLNPIRCIKNPLITQVWRKDSLVCVKVNIVMIMKYSVSLQDICLQTFPCHTDSVWDLKLHNNTVVKDLNYKNKKTIKYFARQATAGLDGAVILYDFVSDYDLRVRCYIQVRGGDSQHFIITLLHVCQTWSREPLAGDFHS